MKPIQHLRGRIGPVLAAVVLTVLLLWLVKATIDVFLLLFIAIILSLYLGSVRDFLVRRARLEPRVAFFLAVAITLLGFVGLFYLLVPPVFTQTRELLSVLPTYISAWETAIDRFMVRLPGMQSYWRPGDHRVIRAVYDQFSGTFQGLVPKVLSLVTVLIEVFSVIVMSIYLALQPGVYREWLIALFPPVHRDLVRDVLHDLADSLRAYIVGQLTAMGVLAVLTAIGLYLLNVPYWLTFGVFTGVVAVVPFFGTLLSTILPAAFVLSGPGGGTRAMFVVLLGVVIHLIEGNLVAPMVMSRRVELPPVLTIMAVLVIGKMLGPVGFIVAVPTLAAAMVIVRRILITRIYEGKGFRRAERNRMFVLRVPVPDGGVLLPDNQTIDVLAFRTRTAS